MNSWGLDHFAGRIVDWFYLHLSKGDMQMLEVRGHLGVSSFLPGDWTQACCWAPSTSESPHHPKLWILKSAPAAEKNEKLITVDYNHADFNCTRFLTHAHQNDNKMWLQVPRGSGWLLWKAGLIVATFKDHLDVCLGWGSKWYPRLPSLTNRHQENDTLCPKPPRTFCHHKESFLRDTTHWRIIGVGDWGAWYLYLCSRWKPGLCLTFLKVLRGRTFFYLMSRTTISQSSTNPCSSWKLKTNRRTCGFQQNCNTMGLNNLDRCFSF